MKQIYGTWYKLFSQKGGENTYAPTTKALIKQPIKGTTNLYTYFKKNKNCVASLQKIFPATKRGVRDLKARKQVSKKGEAEPGTESEIKTGNGWGRARGRRSG